MTLRLFVALEPPGPVRRRLAAVVEGIRGRSGSAALDVKWVAPENVHLTLQFLGNVPEERLPALRDALGAVAAGARPLHLEVRGAGGFPNARRPRAIFAAVAGETEPLAALAAELARRLAPLGFPPDDRPWRPHLTLGRARGGGAPGLAGALSAVAAAEMGSWRAAELVLFRSHLASGEPRYEALLRAPLGLAR